MSEYQRAELLVNHPSLGDRKPSKLMDSMLSLVPENYVPDFVFRYMFLRRLPAEVRAHLVKNRIEDRHELAEEADRLFVALRREANVVTAISPDPEDSYTPGNS